MIENMNHITLGISIVLAAVIVAGIYATSIGAAFARHDIAMNSIRNMRVNQDANVNHGPVTQTSTISCDCSSSDNNNNEG
jgi:hypothetical protein